MFVDHMLCAIDGAQTTELARVGSDISRAYGNGALGEDDYQRLWEAIEERQQDIRAARQPAVRPRQPAPARRTETRPKPRVARNNAPRASAQRPGREKLFGNGRPVPLDREGKNRITVLVRALTHPTEAGKHYGAITAKAAEVARVLLWVFHNAVNGRCFPSYDTIAKEAGCHRDTVAEAIKMLEDAGILTWCNRRARVTIRGVRKVIRISNSYRFIDPRSKSEIPSGTKNQELLSLKKTAEAACTAAKRLGEQAERSGPCIPDGVYPCEEVT